MKECRVCGKTEIENEKANLRGGYDSAIIWYRCPVHGDFCGRCVGESGLMAKPLCKMCGKKLVSKRWF